MAGDNCILVSVVIPAYNRERCIKETIESVLAQTIDDLEVIVVDDGSTDRTKDVVLSFEDGRVKYIYQKNSGANVARNTGMEVARGEYISLLDSDDLFIENHLETSINFIKNSGADVVYSRIIVDRGVDKFFLKPQRMPRDNEEISEYLCCDVGFMQTSTLVMRSSFGKSCKFLNWLKNGQDVDYALRLKNAGAKIKMLENPSVIWSDVQDENRISAKSVPETHLRWVSECRELLTDRAYWGVIGWRVAKSYAQNGQKIKAFRCYFDALIRGAYEPKHAARVFLQILFINGGYRKMANIYQKLFHNKH